MKRTTERQNITSLAKATEYYPSYFEDYDIETDMDMVRISKKYDNYRDMGGFLDKISYFEVKSITRESRSAMNNFRKPSNDRKKRAFIDREPPKNYEEFTLKKNLVIPGTEYMVEEGDVIRVYNEE